MSSVITTVQSNTATTIATRLSFLAHSPSGCFNVTGQHYMGTHISFRRRSRAREHNNCCQSFLLDPFFLRTGRRPRNILLCLQSVSGRRMCSQESIEPPLHCRAERYRSYAKLGERLEWVFVETRHLFGSQWGHSRFLGRNDGHASLWGLRNRPSSQWLSCKLLRGATTPFPSDGFLHSNGPRICV